MSQELSQSNYPNYPSFDLDALNQDLVAAAIEAAAIEWQRIAALPDYADALQNKRAEIEQQYPGEEPLEVKVADYLNERADEIATTIEYDGQPTDPDRAFLTRYLGQPEGTTLVDLHKTYYRRVEYLYALEGAMRGTVTLGHYRTYDEALTAIIRNHMSKEDS